MPKNTFILVVCLAIIASLLIGFNVGKKFNQAPETTVPLPALSPTPKPLTTLPYTNVSCGVSLSYPETMTVKEATQSATFSSKTEAVILACQKDIPGIAVANENKEVFTIGSVAGTLYHTQAPKDGTPITILMFHHPKTDMDVVVSGIGSAFTTIINSLTLK